MTRKIGFIGVGNMGSAIIRGLASRDVVLHGVDHDKARLHAMVEEVGLIAHHSAHDLARECEIIVVAVKPQHAEPVVKEIATELDGSKCLVSICAGITQAMFKDWTEGLCPVVRVMPNIPALVNEGVFAVCLDDKDLSDTMHSAIPALFEGIGQVHILPEKLFDAFTGVIGSGPAYVFYFMEALVESAVALGLSRPQATQMVKGLFSGSARLAAESDLSITQLREMVTSPGGTTVRALTHFDRQGVRGSIIDGAFESYLRSVELGE
ncbi:pyrroline-5-carboxylate reductase [Pseudodesulfovibrio pelocollis]|uniref:pyrroline-5-carboxylate reductase n=1 Tax=Pseudodesulfovibrio pelocollis TaxID=3051432 RepID=UPI00255A8AC4|nr:pyrroline-5-carboxylate reductase [Pseudodesulfovibrio sp. SB368]